MRTPGVKPGSQAREGGLCDAATVHYVRVESCSFGVRCVVGARILIGFLLNYDGNLLFSFSEGRLISVTRVLSQCLFLGKTSPKVCA